MLVWLVAYALAAEPPEGGTAPAAAAEASSARLRIDAAVSMYLAGETSVARRILQGVLADGPSLAPAERQDALAWLGDIQFSEQGISAAQSALATLLAENPDYRMDPLVHPPEYCDTFERLRMDVVRAPVRMGPGPYPWTLGLPFGVGYFIEGKPVPGLVFGTLQLAGAATSVGTAVRMGQIGNGPDIIPASPDGREFRRLRAVNTAAATVGWASWGVPFLVETVSWSVRRTPQVTTISLGPNSVAVSGQF